MDKEANKTNIDALIRGFRKADLDDLLDVASQSFAEEFEVTGFDPDRAREMIDRMFGVLGRIFLGALRLCGREPVKIFVAEVDNRVIGMTMVNNRRKVGYISNVMINPVYRRKGIATRLMKSAFDYVQEKKDRAVLHVVATNTPAKNLYVKLGFRKFESISYLVGDIDSLSKPKSIEDTHVRLFRKDDIDGVYELIKASEESNYLKIVGFSKDDLKTPMLQRIFHFATEKKLIATQNDRIVGYVRANYTTPRETANIRDIHVYPEMRSKGIEMALIGAAIDQIRQGGIKKLLVTVSTKKQELKQALESLGFKKYLEMEGMFLETSRLIMPHQPLD